MTLPLGNKLDINNAIQGIKKNKQETNIPLKQSPPISHIHIQYLYKVNLSMLHNKP